MSKKKIRKPYAGQNNMKNHEAELIALIIIFNTVCAHEEDYAKIKKIMLIKIKLYLVTMIYIIISLKMNCQAEAYMPAIF